MLFFDRQFNPSWPHKHRYFNPLSANPTTWSNTLKQFVGNLPKNCLSVFDHFAELALKGLLFTITKKYLCRAFVCFCNIWRLYEEKYIWWFMMSRWYSWVFSWCSVIPPLFQGVPFFHRWSVFCCLLVFRSWLHYQKR